MAQDARANPRERLPAARCPLPWANGGRLTATGCGLISTGHAAQPTPHRPPPAVR